MRQAKWRATGLDDGPEMGPRRAGGTAETSKAEVGRTLEGRAGPNRSAARLLSGS